MLPAMVFPEPGDLALLWAPKATAGCINPWKTQSQDARAELTKHRGETASTALVSIYSCCFPAKSLGTKSRRHC